jgi:hypothetical protein
MKTTLNFHDALVSAPPEMPWNLISASFDAKTREIVANFSDGKVARVPSTEFDELATAAIADDEFLDATRAGVTCLAETVEFAVAASWWRKRAQ